MKIALCSTYAPFVLGGGRNVVEWLEPYLRERGHSVERNYLPTVDTPDTLFAQMAALRWMDLSAADRIICFRPQSHLIPHSNKVLWFIHHIRVYYDLWDSDYRGVPDDPRHRGLREALHAIDTNALKEARSVFTNSRVVAERLQKYNGIPSEVLYPPIFQPDRFHCRRYGDEIVCICRLEHHKRQHLLIEAMRYTNSAVTLRICGASAGADYPQSLRKRIAALGLQDRVTLDVRWISETEKADLLADCLAAAYIPLDEDSYGYPSLEASHSAKSIITTTDSGGVSELVTDGFNGFVCRPNAICIAEIMDELYFHRELAKRLGRNALERLAELNISWDHVLSRLLA